MAGERETEKTGMNGVVLVLNLGAPAGQAALSLHFLLFPKETRLWEGLFWLLSFPGSWSDSTAHFFECAFVSGLPRIPGIPPIIEYCSQKEKRVQ